MLTTDMRKPPITSINEVLEKNYSVIVDKRGPDILEAKRIFKNDDR